jgi:hypothetical protein
VLKSSAEQRGTTRVRLPAGKVPPALFSFLVGRAAQASVYASAEQVLRGSSGAVSVRALPSKGFTVVTSTTGGSYTVTSGAGVTTVR